MPKSRRQRSLYPEPGLWVAQDCRGLPEVIPPEALPERKLTTREVRTYVAHEGLGYCVFGYIDPSRIADRELALLWSKAREAMQDIVDCLEHVPRVRPIRVVVGEEVTE